MEPLEVIVNEIVLLDNSKMIEVIEVAQQGEPGRDGVGASVSTDANNRLTRGTDDGLYVNDDLTPDPLAYYILAKA